MLMLRIEHKQDTTDVALQYNQRKKSVHIVVTAAKINNKALHYFAVNTVSTSKWLHLIRRSIEHPKPILHNRLLTRLCTKCQPERRHKQHTTDTKKKAELTFLKLKSLIGVACAIQVSTAAYNRARCDLAA